MNEGHRALGIALLAAASRQHLHMVSEHQELDLTPLIWASSGSEDAANEEVDEREQHGAPSGKGERMLTVVVAPSPADRGF